MYSKMKEHDTNYEQFRSSDDGSNDHTVGCNYFNSLTHDQKRNVIATYGYSDKNDKVTHVKLEDVDTTGLEFDDLDKWAKKGIVDMAKDKFLRNPRYN